MPLALALVSALVKEPFWASFRWLASVDVRVLGTSLAAGLLLLLWGVGVGWRGPRASEEETRD